MKTVKGPGIFLAQFAGDKQPFNKLPDIARWAAGLGFKGVQIPSWDARLFDLKLASESQSYCDELLGMLVRVPVGFRFQREKFLVVPNRQTVPCHLPGQI